MKDNYSGSEEYEVRLADVFWSVLRHWRGLIVGMIVFGILIGLLGAFREYRRYSDPASRARIEDEYSETMEQYERSKEAYEAKIENLTEWLGMLDEYKENSLMLLMDPYDVYRSTITYYIDTGYEIMPGVSYQNPNYTGVLVNSYTAAILRLPFDELIDLPGGPDLTTAHTVSKYSSKKVCSVDTDVNNGLLTVSVICDTEERCNVIMDAVRKTVADTQRQLTQIVGEHSIAVTGENSRRTVDLDLANLQTAFTNDYESDSTELTKAQEALKELEKPVRTVHSRRTIVKQAIKYGILGLLIGLLVSIVCCLLKEHDRSLSGLQRRYGVPVLGTLNASGRVLGKLDRRIVSKLGMPEYEDEIHASDYISSAIRLFDQKTEGPLLFIGGASEDNIRTAMKTVSERMPGREIRYGGNIRVSADAVDGLSQPSEIICVEEWPGYADKEIAREMDMLSALQKVPVGFILIV